MATSNRRVAAYLPPEVDEAFLEYKIQRGLATREAPNQNDSQALIQMMSEHLKVTHPKAHSVAHQANLLEDENFQDLYNKVEALYRKFESESSSDSLGELLKRLDRFEQRLAVIESDVMQSKTFSTNELAKRLNMPASSLSHWKSDDPRRGKSPDELLKATREKDPDGIGWILIPELNRFKPEKPLPSDSPVVQGDLLVSEPLE